MTTQKFSDYLASAIAPATYRMSNRIRGRTASGLWIDDSSYSASLVNYWDAIDLASLVGQPLTTNWLDRTTSKIFAPTGSPYVQPGRIRGLPCLRLNPTSGTQYVQASSLALDPGDLVEVWVFDSYQKAPNSSLSLYNGITSDANFWIWCTGQTNGALYAHGTYSNNTGNIPEGLTILVIKSTAAGGIKMWMNNGTAGAAAACGTGAAVASGWTITTRQVGKNSGLGSPLSFDLYAHAVYSPALSDAACLALCQSMIDHYSPPTVFSDNKKDLVVWIGDSRVWGAKADYVSKQFPDLVMREFPGADFVNLGNPGSSANAFASGTYLDPYQGSGRGKTIVVLESGINDYNGGASGATVSGYLASAAVYAKTKGVNAVICCTTAPSNTTHGTGALEAARLAGNVIVRADTTNFDAVADFADDPTLTDGAGNPNTTYMPDSLHFNAAGNRIKANYVIPLLRNLLYPEARGTSGRTLLDVTANVGNSTTVETDLLTYTLPISLLTQTGDKLTAFASLAIVGHATATSKIKAYFGGSSRFDSGDVALTVSAVWTVSMELVRTGTTTGRLTVVMTAVGATPVNYSAEVDMTSLSYVVPSNILKITGTRANTGAATNDITLKHGYIRYEPALAPVATV